MYCIGTKQLKTSDECIVALNDIVANPSSVEYIKIRKDIVTLCAKEHSEIRIAAASALAALIHANLNTEFAKEDLNTLAPYPDQLVQFLKSISYPVSKEYQQFILAYLARRKSIHCIDSFTALLTHEATALAEFANVESWLRKEADDGDRSVLEAFVNIAAIKSAEGGIDNFFQQQTTPGWARVKYMEKCRVNQDSEKQSKRMIQINTALVQLFTGSPSSEIMAMAPTALSAALLGKPVDNTVESANKLYHHYRNFSSQMCCRTSATYPAYVPYDQLKSPGSDTAADDNEIADQVDEYEYELYQDLSQGFEESSQIIIQATILSIAVQALLKYDNDWDLYYCDALESIQNCHQTLRSTGSAAPLFPLFRNLAMYYLDYRPGAQTITYSGKEWLVLMILHELHHSNMDLFIRAAQFGDLSSHESMSEIVGVVAAKQPFRLTNLVLAALILKEYLNFDSEIGGPISLTANVPAPIYKLFIGPPVFFDAKAEDLLTVVFDGDVEPYAIALVYLAEKLSVDDLRKTEAFWMNLPRGKQPGSQNVQLATKIVEARLHPALQDLSPINRTNVYLLLGAVTNRLVDSVSVQWKVYSESTTAEDMAALRERLPDKETLAEILKSGPQTPPASMVWSDLMAYVGLASTTGPADLPLNKLIEIICCSLNQKKVKESEVIISEILPRYENESWAKVSAIPNKTSALLAETLLENQPLVWKSINTLLLGLIDTSNFVQRLNLMFSEATYSQYESTLQILAGTEVMTSPLLLRKTASLIASSGSTPPKLGAIQRLYCGLDRASRKVQSAQVLSLLAPLFPIRVPNDKDEAAYMLTFLTELGEFFSEYKNRKLCPRLLYDMNPTMADELLKLCQANEKFICRVVVGGNICLTTDDLISVRRLALQTLQKYKAVIHKGRYYTRNPLPEELYSDVNHCWIEGCIVATEDSDEIFHSEGGAGLLDNLTTSAIPKQKLDKYLTRVKMLATKLKKDSSTDMSLMKHRSLVEKIITNSER